MNPPLVSICIATYNHESYIHDCIMSVISQCNDVALEILIGDDHSVDGAAAIIQKLKNIYPDIIHYIRYPKRIGYGSKNYQNLLQKSRGTYIAHLDGDDYWLPGKLRTQISFLEQNPLCSAVYTNALVIHENNEPAGIFNNTQPTIFNINRLILRGNYLNNSSMLYRESFKKNILELQAPFIDYQINLCNALEGSIGYVNQALTVYRLNSNNSVLVNANDRIRKLYWKALIEVPAGAVNITTLSRGMAEFGRSVFFRSLKIKKISLLQQWLPIILKAAPTGKLKMILLIIAAIFRVGTQEGLSMICRKLTGNKTKILYQR